MLPILERSVTRAGRFAPAAAVFTAALVALLLCSGCAGPGAAVPDGAGQAAAVPDDAFPGAPVSSPAWPVTRFGVISDPHFYDPTLGTEGDAFREYLNGDRKLLLESGALVDAALAGLAASDLDFLLVCGDLTKDGELSGHRLMAEKLAGLEAAGTPVFVVPGNHDIANGWAVRYEADRTEQVPTVSAAEFADIYAAFGYAEALHRDPFSLSYVAEPLPGLWLLALDSCRYREQDPADGEEPITGGLLPQATLDWLVRILKLAATEKKALAVFLHHAVVEHHPGQAKHDPEYLLENYQEVGRLLAAWGVRVAFSGHDHAQDITLKRFDTDSGAGGTDAGPDGAGPDGAGGAPFLYDVETGSLVTYPCPYRIVETRPGRKLAVTSTFIDGIPGYPDGFTAYARRDVIDGIAGIAVSRMVNDYGVSEKDAALIAPQVAAAYAAHYAGDERPEGKVISRKGVGLWGRIILAAQKSVITGRWVDFPPPDNDVILDLADPANLPAPAAESGERK